MAIDRDKYIGKYIDEGIENISLVETLIFDIKDGVSVEDDLATLLRALHTLKGSSRVLEFKRIETLSHALESVFVAVKEQRIGLSENAIKLVLASLDKLKTGLGVVQREKNDDISIDEYEKKLNALAVNEEWTLPETFAVDEVAAADEKTAGQITKINGPGELRRKEVLQTAADAGALKPKTAKPTGEKNAKSESIRLPLEKIDGIIKSIAPLQSLEISAKTIAADCAALNNLIKEFSRVLKADKSLDPALAENFRKLERLNLRINSAIKNYAADTGNLARGAYDSIISLRTLPLSTILDAYPRFVFELASELGKEVHLEIEGKETEIDKNIIELLADVFLHMTRNAIDHGIESPQERAASGKNKAGNLSIICARESGNIKIVISDDGRGIDLGKIRKKAAQSGYVTEAQSAALSKEDLTNFIFQSGFSTSAKVSNVSGRGIGMDAVQKNIERLKGSIIVDSVFGQGTTFTIMAPLSIAALTGFPITCGGLEFIIPANFIDTILLVNKQDIVTVVDRPEIKYGGRFIKFYYLNQILKIKNGTYANSDVVFAVIIRAFDDIIALAVDSISSMRSVILKTMPAFMEHIPVFSGIVLNENYEMLTALHIPTIIKLAKRIKTLDMKKRNIEFARTRKSILVVDDSLPTREIESEILMSEGYFVDTAANGAEALQAAKHKQYNLICTDINMPIMDGFMLTENIRKNEELSQIPIIMISSLASDEYQKRAAMLGASRYIIKNSFNNHNLLEAVRSLIGSANE
ncbi:MAG: hybrid sensor histidine kinase/response regulator [Treponemataceae bacterium]|nr:MAG: hybrid sensor histidine kinase/response regulator [Treponemataceae bacterium]